MSRLLRRAMLVAAAAAAVAAAGWWMIHMPAVQDAVLRRAIETSTVK